MKVTKNNKPLSEDRYTLNYRTFISNEDNLKIECGDDYLIDCRNNCKIYCWKNCLINCFNNCKIYCLNNCTITADKRTEVYGCFGGKFYTYKFTKRQTIKFKDGKVEVLE